MKNFLNKVFKIEENQTTIRAEIIGGITTFFAMCYIVIVNPGSITQGSDPDLWNAVFIGGIIAAVIATLCMAFIANKPFALAAGMGLNSFFYASFIGPCLSKGIAAKDGFGAGLAIILISGFIFLLLSVTGLRKYIAQSLPGCLKNAIPAGIGLFIAFIGLKNAGLIVDNQFNFVALADLTDGKVALKVLVPLIGLLIIVVLSLMKKVPFLQKGAIIIGILVSTGLYYAFGFKADFAKVSIGESFKDFAKYGLFNCDFKTAFGKEYVTMLGGIFNVIMLIVTFCLVDMFDTLGTLYGASAEAGMLDENGDPIALDKEMLCDSIGTVVGAVTGTSTITTYVESSAGIAAGARTGLASMITALLFIVCLFMAPLAKFVPACATAPALIFVGVLMCRNITKVDFGDLAEAVPAFLAFLMMPLTYSISNGIMIGAIAYVLIRLCSGKLAKKDIVISVIAILAVLRFIFVPQM